MQNMSKCHEDSMKPNGDLQYKQKSMLSLPSTSLMFEADSPALNYTRFAVDGRSWGQDFGHPPCGL